jgi:hypothetical protein
MICACGIIVYFFLDRSFSIILRYIKNINIKIISTIVYTGNANSIFTKRIKISLNDIPGGGFPMEGIAIVILLTFSELFRFTICKNITNIHVFH